MKILVIGRGVAALAFLDTVLSDPKLSQHDLEISWVGPNFDTSRFPNCSLNSTALVARHGIERGISPLGDLLYESFYLTKKFLTKNSPEGISELPRFHMNSRDKLASRFGSEEIQDINFCDLTFSGVVKESAWHVNTSVFLKWWHKRIEGLGLEPIEDFITQINSIHAIGLKGQYEFDFCVNASGALGRSVELQREGTIVPGQYLYYKSVKFKKFGITKPFVVSKGSFNFIYSHSTNSILFGGTNENDGVMCPKGQPLLEAIKDLVKEVPGIDFSGNLEFRTGARHKASKRMPKIIKEESVYTICGLYKNGYTISHKLAAELVEMLKCEALGSEKPSP